MAHVLLPCDLPNWAELQRQLSQVRLAQTVEQLMKDFLKIYDSCSVGLDPDEAPPIGDTTRFAGLNIYLHDFLLDAERVHFFKAILPSLVSNAQRLRIVRPLSPFQFSLQQEAKVIHLERRFLSSILANALFSTFPRRTMKTHPTLQDFSFGEFYRHMKRSSQQEKLKYIFKYFEKISVTDPKGTIRFCRQVLSESSIPSMPSWLCNTKTLCPVAARHYGNIEDSETQMIKACFCSPRIGGKTLLDDDKQEALMFCRMPELITSLCFVESIEPNEAVLVQGVSVLGRLGESALSILDGDKEADVVLMDALDFSDNVYRQYEDKYLLRDLTKLLVAFSQPQAMKRPSPLGESSGSSTCPERESPATGTTGRSSTASSRRSSNQSLRNTQDGLFTKLPSYKLSHSESTPAILTKEPCHTTANPLSTNNDVVKSSARHSLPMIRRNSKTELQNLYESSARSKERSRHDSLLTSAAIHRSKSTPHANVPKEAAAQKSTRKDSKEGKSQHRRSSRKSPRKEEAPAKSESSTRKSTHRSNTYSEKGERHHRHHRPYHSTESSTHPLNVNPLTTDDTNTKQNVPRLPPIHNPLSMLLSRKPSFTKVTPKRRIMYQTSGEEEYYTADESADSCDEVWFLPGLGLSTSKEDEKYTPSMTHHNIMGYQKLSEKSSSRSSADKTESRDSSSKRHSSSRSKSSSPSASDRGLRRRTSSEGKSSHRSKSNDSKGLALGDGSGNEDDAMNLSEFERYEDFRKRFRRRSRGLSRRKSSRHSRTSSSGSSEMEDIEEDPELGFGLWGAEPTMRSASSEPSLVTIVPSENTMQLANMLAVPADTLIMAKRGRKLVMTTGDGQLKAYSYDGVHPNLPVPFKAKFRQRRHSGEPVCDLQTNGRHFYSQANAGFWKKVEAEAQIGVTSGSSSHDEYDDSDPSDEGRSRRRSRSSGSRRSISSGEDNRLIEEEEKYYSLLRSSEEGLRPVATGRWGCGRQRGDPQLKAVLQWVAASVAGLPYLIYYTKGDPLLEKLEQLSKVAELKQWTVGDVACETLRYCRNRLSLHRSGNDQQRLTPFLFTMLMGDSLIMKQQESLD